MIVQHRLIGNIPGRGHGDPLLSSAFPLDSALTTTTVYRAPDPGYIPAQAGRLTEDGKYNVHLTTFEIQSPHFGKPVLISANIFRPANANTRPMMYMNTVAMTDETGAQTCSLTPMELLSFDRFITPAHFASLNAMSKALDADRWNPAVFPERKPFFAPKTAAHRALLGYYWSSASARLFGGNTPVFSICLGKDIACQTIIENAKSLLLCDILPYLPDAVRNIASMSACVLESSVRTMFKDSAMAVIFPTDPADPKQPTFDLCKPNGYPTLPPLEDRFMTDTMNGSCTFMQDAASRYMALTGGIDTAQISFTADFDLALMMYQLERTLLAGESLIAPGSLIAAWKQLNAMLISRHRLTLEQANHVLAGVEKKLFAAVLQSKTALDVIQSGDMPALWQKALTVEESPFSVISSVIAACPGAVEFPKMLESLLNDDAECERRSAQLIRKIGTGHCALKPFTSELVAQLTAAPMAERLSKHPSVREALADGLRRNNDGFPENLLTTLPLSCALLDGKQALCDAVALLRRSHVKTLPSPAHMENLTAACASFMNQEAGSGLCAYFAECLPGQMPDLSALCAMMVSLLPDPGEAILAVLDSADQNSILFDAAQTCALFDRPLAACRQPGRIGSAYAAYESNLSARTGEPFGTRLMRLCQCANVLRAAGFDATHAAEDIITGFSLENRLFAPEQSEAFVRRLLPLCRNQSKIADAFQTYIVAVTQNDPLFYFNNIDALNSLAPFIAVNRTDMTGTVCGILKAIAVSHPFAHAAQLDVFFGRLLAQCADPGSVRAHFYAYFSASVEHALAQPGDYFPWLFDIQALAAKHGLIAGQHAETFARQIAQYICENCRAHNRAPSDAAFAWLIDFALKMPLVFTDESKRIFALYDALLPTSAGPQAAQQAAQLIPHIASTTAYPSVCALDQHNTSAAFCAALAKSGYDGAFPAVQSSMNRCALSEEELLGRTQREAREALMRQFSGFRKLSDYEQAFRRIPAAPRDHFFNDILREAFSAMKAERMRGQLTLEQMDKLNAAAKLLGCDTNSLPQTIRQLADTVCRPGYDGRAFAECMQRIGRERIEPEKITAELTGLIKERMSGLSWPQNVHAALLCSLSANGKQANWKKVFSLLGMNLPEKLQPYSAQGQAWLAAIHAVCRALDLIEAQPGCSFGRSLVDWLSRGELAEFSDAAIRDQKRLALFYPEQARRSPLLRRWLES